MKKTYFVIFLVLSGILFLLTGSEESDLGPKQERFEQYLIGIKYLEAAKELSLEERIVYYNKLVKLTNFSADKAKNYLNQFKDDPEKWEKTINSVISILEKDNQINKE